MQVENGSGMLDEKENWVEIAGEFVANGNETFTYIGSPETYDNMNILELSEEPLGNDASFSVAYYYIDDVTVCAKLDQECSCEINSNSTDGYDNSFSQPEIPNVFTPNGDKENDIWSIQLLKEDDIVIIMNRWGQKVAVLNLENPSWDGLKNGKPLSEGTYFYNAFINGESKHGFIQLAR